jgi:hypothetical protein
MAYGDGRLYLRGGVYWAQWYENGRQIRRSTDTRYESEAKKYLRDRLYEASNGISAPAGAKKLRMSDLFDLVVEDYEKNGFSSIEELKRRLKLQLIPEFGHLRPDQITTDRINEYIKKRKRKDSNKRTPRGAANGTINRELATVIRAFTIASESEPPKVSRIPKINLLEERNVRKGFLTDSEFERLAAACIKRGIWLLGILLVGFTYGVSV